MSGVPQGEVCDICGDVGVIEAISKCFKCKINQQHFYCGKTYPQNMSGEWYCDDCEKETTASPKHVNRDILAASKSGKHRREEKMATKGKVKCIPCEEVIKLSSGSKKGESPIKKAIKNSKFLPQTITGAVRPGVEVKVAIPGKERYKASEASNTQKQFPELISFAAVRPAVEVNVATLRKSISKAGEASSTLSPKKPSHQLINSVTEPSVETKVGSVGKEVYKASEASNALSPEKRSQQPIGSGAVRRGLEVKFATPGKERYKTSEASNTQKQFPELSSSAAVRPAVEVSVSTPRKSISKASQASRTLSPEKASHLLINSEPSVETKVGAVGKELYKASEASNALLPKKQFPELISSAAVRPAVEVNVATPWKSISKAGEASSTLSPEKPSHQLINSAAVRPAVEVNVATPWKSISKAGEASSTLSPEKPSHQLINSGANDATIVKVTSTPHDGLCGQFSEKQLSPLTSPGHQVSADLDPIASDVGNFEAMNVEPKGPSLVYSWRGRFKISGETFKNINSWFKAHPRFRVIRNVVDILLHMPELLQFKLIYRRDVWIELFQDDCPDEDDIGLYVFPENKRSSSDYDFLRLFIEENDYAMKYDLNGVELFLFTSKVLVADSQKLKGDYFIWGVFRPIKKEKYVSKLYEELPLVVHRPSDSAQTSNFSNNNDNDNGCSIDMEIDMVAGNDVGRVDVAVPRDLSSGAFPLQEIKKEEGLGCPPGFEEIFRLKKLVQ